MHSETVHQPNTSGLVEHARRKSQETHQRVDQAIDQLLREEGVINFNTVSKAASVTKSYLYAHPELRDRVETLRQQQQQTRLQHQQVQQFQQSRTDKSKDVLLVAKDRRIKALENEIQKLKTELKTAYGKLYEQV